MDAEELLLIKRTLKAAVLVASVSCVSARAAEALPAFPGAEGFGAKASPNGARARVIRVTTLKPSGPGP